MPKSTSTTTTPPSISNFAGVEIRVDYVSPALLRPANRQVRAHPRRQLNGLARSIDEFAFLNPILVDEQMQIVAGHGRWQAAQLLGLSSVPIIRIEHLTEAQRRLFAIADNKLPEGARWDDGALLLEFNEIELLEPEIELTSSGFAIAEIDTIFGRQRTAELDDSDELGEIKPVPVSRVGDRYRLGEHILGCGDARDLAFIQSLMAGRSARLLLTDPPWNLKIENVVSGRGKKKHSDFVMATGEMSNEEFTTFLAEFIAAARDCLVDGALLYMFIDWRTLDLLNAAALRCDLVQKNLLVWCKDNAGLGSLYRSQHELITLFKHGDAPHLNNVMMGQHGRNRSNVLFYPGANSFGKGRDAALAIHPTSKPIALLADILLDVTAPGDLVLDLFGGSGSTLIAAERVGRKACLVELEPTYVDAIIRRFEALTGLSAVHIDEGKTFTEIAADRLDIPEQEEE